MPSKPKPPKFEACREDSAEQTHELFEKHAAQHHKFGRIPVKDRRHERPDLCAMLYLHERFGGKGVAVSSVGHDTFYLSWDVSVPFTNEDVLYLTRCGVMLDTDTDSLMFIR